MLLWTLKLKWPPLLHHQLWKNHTNCQMVRLLPSETKDSDPLNLSSSRHSWVWKLLVSTKPLTLQSWSATLISARTCTPTTSCQVVPPCTRVLLIVCRRRSPPWPQAPWRSRSSPHQSVNTPSGSVVQSWLHCRPFSQCGSPRLNMMSLAHQLFTVNAFKDLWQKAVYFFISIFKSKAKIYA